MYIIAGLGNPTKEYEGTRHNVGFDVIDRLSERYNIDVTMEKHRALIGTGMIAGQKVILVKPKTYMNLSGESIRSVIDYYKVDPEKELIVIYDDISLGVCLLYTSVADQLGISQSYISRLEKKIMHRLRMEMVRYE